MGLTRRGFIASAALSGAAAAAGTVPEALAHPAGASVDFFGHHQAGIATPSQRYLQFAALDLFAGGDLRGLLMDWSRAAALLTAGKPVGAVSTGDSAPVDTGEALGLPASSLTVTFGFGPSLFSTSTRAQYGITAPRPGPLVDLPAFEGDQLDESLCGGAVGVQVCAEDPQVAFHGLHELFRIGASVAQPRWVLGGFGQVANGRHQQTPRNLFGFKDGTANIVGEDSRALDEFVWAAPPESPAWMVGGSYMVVRRIRMELAAWDALSLDGQERTFGRRKVSGAPLTGRREHDPLDLQRRSYGASVIPRNAHVRLASPEYNRGQRILRRGYSYLDGLDIATGSLSGGQLFICFQRDPRVQFIPMMRRLAGADALNRHTVHVGAAIFACPPGVSTGGFVGEGLFA